LLFAPPLPSTPGGYFVHSVEVRNVSLGYGTGAETSLVLKQVSLGLSPGRLIVISGPSGSGKTSLISIIGAMIAPDSGEVIVDGVNIGSLTEEERASFRREKIGYVFQSFRLMAALTAEENVSLSLELRRIGRRRERCQAALETVGLAAKGKLKPHQMSHGEKQRVAIARAIAHTPPVVLADEPTASLDAANGTQVTNLLSDIARDPTRTVAIVTHDPRVIPLAQRIIRLEDGRIVGDQQ
jgi:putative ABC transport system ATP-binding protein